MICDNISVNEHGHLCFAGHDTGELAAKYGTPLYLMDEDKIREKCRKYVEAMKNYLPEGSMALYASKAASFKRMYEIVLEEGMGADVVSSGEIFTAIKAGFPISNCFFHSNNKTDWDIDFAIKNGIGYFVVDSREELLVINDTAKNYGISQKVLLRLTPGIDTHTYEAVNTGKVDSKFGTAIETGQAKEITQLALDLENITLSGFHCHIGSQVFDSDTFCRGAAIMLEFIADIKNTYGYTPELLDLGGGYGVRYTESDPEGLDIEKEIESLSQCLYEICDRLSIECPRILLEPGRSIVGDAGMTLYTVGSVKRITGYKNYVSVDGGMTDNPRYALYGSKYTIYNALKMNSERTLVADIAGRCCESGDIIGADIRLAECERGDIIAVLTTGAYNYSMASNYNRLTRPPVVMLTHDGSDYIAVKRETLEYLTENDI